MRNILSFVVISLTLFTSCEEEKTKAQKPKTAQNIEVLPPSIGDTAIVFRYDDFESEVIIQKPEAEFKGTILVLQGWNFSNSSWCDSSDLCERASKAGYYLVMPYMGKSIYHNKVYPATRKDWRKYPTRQWLMEDVLATLSKEYNLFQKDHKNCIMGLSTGGRGALLIAQEYPEIFTAAASLSGDYDQSAFPNDNLYRGYFGTDSSEWSAIENPVSTIDLWTVPMYFGHGTADSVVSISHMSHLNDLLQKHNPQLNAEFHESTDEGHNYRFWSSELKAIFGFFEKSKP